MAECHTDELAGVARRVSLARFDLALRRTELPVVICIDVEPDDRTFDPSNPRPWRGFERLVELLPGLHRRLRTAVGTTPALVSRHSPLCASRISKRS